MDQEDSWFLLTPGIVHQDKPAIFGPKEVTHVAGHSLTGSQDAGLYTRRELRAFWDNFLVNAASRSALKNFLQNLIFYSASRKGPDGPHYYAPRTEFYVDKMTSPEYFRNNLMDTCRPIAYVFEHCGIYFSVFLFPKLIIDPIVLVIRHMEIKKLTGASIGFDKTLLSASYNIFVTSVLTSVFDPHAPFLAAIEQNKINPKLGGELKEMRTEEDPNTGDEHLYPIMNPTAFHSLSLSLAPVQCHFQPLTILFFFKPTDFNTLPLLDRSELLSVLGDPDLELEPFTPACLDRTPGPLFTFLTPISSRVSPIVGPAIDQSENQKQPTSNTVPVSPTFNALLYKSHPFPSCYPESEDEPRQSSSSSRRDVRPFSLHPKHFKSQSQADTVTLHWQHERLIRFPGNSYQKA